MQTEAYSDAIRRVEQHNTASDPVKMKKRNI